jgi:hypothetical protein
MTEAASMTRESVALIRFPSPNLFPDAAAADDDGCLSRWTPCDPIH